MLTYRGLHPIVVHVRRSSPVATLKKNILVRCHLVEVHVGLLHPVLDMFDLINSIRFDSISARYINVRCIDFDSI